MGRGLLLTTGLVVFNKDAVRNNLAFLLWEEIICSGYILTKKKEKRDSRVRRIFSKLVSMRVSESVNDNRLIEAQMEFGAVGLGITNKKQ